MIFSRFTNIIFIFVVFAAFKCETILGAQPNLVLNSNIESGSLVPFSWSKSTGSGAMSMSWTTSEKVSGSRSLCASVSVAGQGDWRQLITGINADTHYRFRVHVRASNVDTGSHSAELQWFSADDIYLGRHQFSATSVNDWEELKDNDITPPANASKVYVMMRSYGVGIYYFDDPVFMRKDNNLRTIEGEFPIGLYGLPINNLVINKNIDIHATNSTELPLGWTTSTGSGNPTYSWDPSLAYSGEKSLKITLPGDGSVDWRQLITDIDVNESFNLNARIYTNNVESLSHGVELQWFGDNGYLCKDVFTATVANEWIEINESNIIPPFGAVSVYIILRAYKAGSYNFDDLSFVREQTETERVAEIKNAGFNLLLNLNDTGDLMDEMAVAGDIYGIIFTNMANETETLDSINNNESKPALRIWLGNDEPAWNESLWWDTPILPSIMVDAYNTFLEEDDYFTSYSRAVWINHAPRGTKEYPSDFSLLRPYSEAVDIISMDIYPAGTKGNNDLENTSISCVGEYTKKLYDYVCTDSTGLQDKVIWMVLQNFNWPDLGDLAPHGVEVHWLDNADKVLRRDFFYISSVNSWDLITAKNLIPPSGATTAAIALRGYAVGTFYFDDVMFMENGVNLLSNSNFETQDGSSGYPASWTRGIAAGTTAVQTWDTSTSVSYTHSAKTSLTVAGQADWQQTVNIDDSKTYTLSAYVKDVTGARISGPTWTETRFMAYDAIINGARGLMYWGTRFIRANSELWPQVKVLGAEISDLSDELVSPESFRSVTVSSGSIEYLLLDTSTGLCLIAANKTANAVINVTFNISGLNLSSMKEYDETAIQMLISNSFTKNFGPYEVKIWEIN